MVSSREAAKTRREAPAVNYTHALGTHRQAAIGISRLVLPLAQAASAIAATVGCRIHTGATAAVDRQTGTLALQRSSGREAAVARSC
jgi:hypothetical protein